MGDHAVGGAQAGGFGLVVAHEQFAHFDKGKMLAPQGVQQGFDLVKGGHQVAEETTRLEGLAHLRDVIPGVGQIQEEGVRIHFGKASRDIPQLESDPPSQAEPLQILTGQLLELRAAFVGDHMPLRADSVGQRNGHGAGAGAGLQDGLTGPDRHAGEDEADVLGVHDLGAALQILQQVRQGGLQDEERAALVAEDLAAPRLADQFIVVQNAAVGVERPAGNEREDEMLVTQAHQEGQVTGLGVGGI